MAPAALDTLVLRAQHPGVVPLTGALSGPHLEDVDLAVEEIAAVFAVLATTLADLHAVGITLGPLSEADIVFGDDGRPVIANLSGVAVVDRGSDTETEDVRRLGGLLATTLGRCSPEVLRCATSRHWPRRRKQRDLTEDLAKWTAAATKGGPTLRHLADGLVHPDARLPHPCISGTRPMGGPGPDATEDDWSASAAGPVGPSDVSQEPADAPRGRARASAVPAHGLPHPAWRRPAIAVLAMTGLALLGLGLSSWRAASRPHLSGTAPSSAAPTSVCLAVSASGSCDVPATYSGGVLKSAMGRFAIGRPDDVVAAGRWTCDPVASLVLLRPDRGEIWAFSGWPGAGDAPLRGRLVARVAQARQLRVHHLGACDALIVGRADGTSIVVDAKAFR